MISVAMLGGGRDAAAYYLDRSADCDLADYYTGERERPGRWCGHGAAALSLTGTVTGAGAAVFSGLLDGNAPDGTVVARPVLRADSRGRLPAAPLARELQRAAADRGAPLVELFDDPRAADTAVRLVASADGASARRPIAVDARVVADLTAAAGLNPHVLYPAGRKGGGFAAAFAHAGQKVDVRRSGLDVVVSAPKSVSVLYGLADQAVAQTVATAHEHAVDEALRYLDRHASHAMRGHQGDGQRARRIGTDGLVAAAFTHRTSRADDPQLHTHLVVANLLHGEDGRWSAVDSRAVHRQARTAGCIYQAVLRGELTRTLGVEWGPVRKGVAEIAGIPRALCREFSTRREQIECELERTGGAGRRAAQRATYRTRQRKTHASEPSLRQTWARRAGELGHDAHQLVADALGRAPAPALPPADVVAAQLFGPDGLTERNTSFDRRDVIQALAETLPPGLPITAAQLEAAADRMLRQTEAVRLVEPVGAGVDEPRWTSADLLATEQTALALAMTTTNVPAHTDGDAAARAATTTGLSSEQQHLVASLLVSPRLVDVVVGPAGSGKTALVRAAAAGWDDVGAPVVGCSLAAVAARRLGAATGIATCSVTRLLADAERVDPDTGHPTGLAPRTVVVVDEASMVGTRNLTALARHVDSCGGKLVLVGDPAQLPEIDAGGLFAALARHAPPLALATNQRQHEQWERVALLALRSGDPDSAIDAYFAHGRIHVGDDAVSATRQLVDAYVAQRVAGATPFDLVALASTHRDVTSLNASVRAALQHGSVVATTGTTMLTSDGPLELAVGDLVLVTRNDHGRGLLNGTRGIVTRTTGTDIELSMESGERRTVPTGWAAEHLDYGYALTVHKAQGLTTEVALIFGTQALDQQAGYVALSRGKVRNHLFTSAESLQRDDPDLDVARFRILDHEPPDVHDALAQRLARSRRHVLASHQRPRVDDGWDRLHQDIQHRSRDGYGIDR